MKILIVGYGEVGCELEHQLRNDYDVDVVDPERYDTHSQVNIAHISELKNIYDVAFIVTPNYTHYPIAVMLAKLGVKRIYVDMPGFQSFSDWSMFKSKYKDVDMRVMNRYNYDLLQVPDTNNIVGISISMLYTNSIPSIQEGSWRTCMSRSFGGTTTQNMPQMFAILHSIVGDMIFDFEFDMTSRRNWGLSQLKPQQNGGSVYNVDDFSSACGRHDGITIKLVASWREGYDYSRVVFHMNDGSVNDIAIEEMVTYKDMVENCIPYNTQFDDELHKFIDNFKEDEND